MVENKGKAEKITNRDQKRRQAGQRIIDSMPAMIDEIRAEREREACKLRKAILEREKNQNGMHNLPLTNRPLRSASNPSKRRIIYGCL
jgi:hypothetical protein